MNDLHDLMINLAAAAVAFLIGVTSKYIVDFARGYRARQFWGPMLKSESRLIVGVFEQFEQFEPSGLMGVGDARALHEVLAHFDKIKIRKFEIGYTNRIEDGDLGSNLVLLGGGDGNKVTAAIMDQTWTGFSFLMDGVTIRDEVLGESFAPKVVDQSVVGDYGIIARVVNPFNPRCEVVIIAGGYGYGSWAGARLLEDSAFLKSAHKNRRFACLYRTTLIDGLPQRAVPIQWHAIS